MLSMHLTNLNVGLLVSFLSVLTHLADIIMRRYPKDLGSLIETARFGNDYYEDFIVEMIAHLLKIIEVGRT